ncbi:MAG TPA: M1 family aminopeptidase [Kofleriaceae bacterium]|nr:M1 family aminopeptidase [Kofleriaceae bacterium]
MSRAWLASALLLAAACGGDDAPAPDAAPPTGPARVHVDRYAYELDVESRASASTLTLHVVEGGDCITLANRNPTLVPSAVTLDGEPAQVTLTPTTITACGRGWYAGTDVTLAAHMMQNLSTISDSQVGYSVGNDSLGKPVFYLVSWVEGCDRFGPCDPTPSAFAHYTITVHHLDGVRALCPGRIDAQPTVTTCTFDYAGGPTYSTFGMIANASWEETDLGTWGGVHATLYAKPTSGVRPLLDPAYGEGFLAWMTSRFGAYPYGDELRFVIAPTYWSGFEHPGNIVLDEGLSRPFGQVYLHPVAHVMAHEMAHQWAGDQTTLAGTYDFVWKESMAEYLSFLYEAEVDPAAAAITASYWKNAARGAGYYPVPLDRPMLFDYYGDVYGPGPMVLFRQLEAMTSREHVVDALKMLLGHERAISVDDVQHALEATTGLDLDNYFAKWVRGSGPPAWPTFTIAVTGDAPAQQVTLTGGAGFPCDFHVGLRGANGETAEVAFARGMDPDASMTVDTDVTWAIQSTVLDPDSECLAFPAATAAHPAPPRHPPGWTPWHLAL